ncbi:hypothetical protein MCEMSE18_00040 [Candidatus Planktophila versatilis]|uniref:hypothetical protein n=1 Tax=Candidatus Planktophila versatilis TaxID=1884905 RepID=UPI003BEF2F16
MKVGILGSGFGLYGYLPAFLGLGMDVSTLQRYKQKIDGRSELSGLLGKVKFFSTEEEILSSCEIIAIARNPSSQTTFIEGLDSTFTHLFLEKPLASSVKEQEKCLERLISLKQNFSIAYLFKYCQWWQKTKDSLNSSKASSIVILWAVPKSVDNWKSLESEGGGIGSYYAVHLIPLIHDLGFDFEIQDFSGDSDLSIVAKNLVGLTLKIRVFRDDNQKFMIYEDLGFSKNIIYEAQTPFGEVGRKGIADSRVPVLMNYILDKLENSYFLAECSVETEILRFRRQLLI